MDTLASQAHGANDARAVKSWTLLVLLVITLACFPAAAFLFSAEAINAGRVETSGGGGERSGKSVRYFIPGVMVYVLEFGVSKVFANAG